MARTTSVTGATITKPSSTAAASPSGSPRRPSKRGSTTRRTGQRGASQTYTDAAILCMLTLMAVYSLRLRSTQG
ncbi:MAG: transposase, partial [Pyrinomonadaceae bacterium]|nr:transposase [Pyrinomonadaceae bacterium]